MSTQECILKAVLFLNLNISFRKGSEKNENAYGLDPISMSSCRILTSVKVTTDLQRKEIRLNCGSKE